MEVEAVAAGRCVGVAQWILLDLDETIISNLPGPIHDNYSDADTTLDANGTLDNTPYANGLAKNEQLDGTDAIGSMTTDAGALEKLFKDCGCD